MNTPRKACVIGFPVKHSRSPLIHGYWLRTLGLAGAYDKVEVQPADLGDFLRRLGAHGYVGCNVTVPHKEAAARLVEAIEGDAETLGAVNTLWLADGRLHGANTDVEGFLSNLDAEAPGWDRRSRHAVILGAGGAARAVVLGLKRRGLRSIGIVNRTPERAREIAALLGPAVTAHPEPALAELLAEADLLVNATSLGMAGRPPLVVDLSSLKPGALVTDLVYVPLETELLADARRRGHPTVDGLGMLLHQAVPGFERWFDVRPSVTPELRALVVDDLRQGS